MSTDLEWHFGDGLPEEAPAEGQPQPRPWRRWLIWIVVLLLSSGAAYAWWHQRQQALDRAEARVRQVARLELRALAEGDVELFLSLQDGADDAWRQAQATYAKTLALPLPLQGITATETSVESARVVGSRARVQMGHTAALSNGRVATFRAVRFYRLASPGRWVHTKADPDYGGQRTSFVEDHVQVEVLERDADWIGPTVAALEALTSDYCDLAPCQGMLPLLLDVGAPLDEAATPGDAVLPAPYLVGAPENGAARAIWEASLEEFLLLRLIDEEIGPRPPDVHPGELFQDRLHAWFRGELGLGESPSPDLELLGDALDKGAWIPLWELWSLRPDDPQRTLAEAEIDLLLAFIEREHGAATVARLPHALQDAYHPGEAIVDVVREPWWAFRRHILAYAREFTTERTDTLASFPSYDLLVTCQETLGAVGIRPIWGLRLAESEVTLLSGDSEIGDLMPMSWSPDGAALLTVRDGRDGVEFYLLEERSSEPRPLSPMVDGAEPVRSLSLEETGWSPDGSRLAYRAPRLSVEGGFLDVRTGESRVFDGDFVAWSPDGSRLIYAQPVPWHWSPELRVQTFWVLDRNGGEPWQLGRGYGAAWSPEGTRVVYATAEPALRIHDLATGERMTLLEKPALRRTLSFTPTLSPVSGRPFDINWSPTGSWIALAATRSYPARSEETLTMVVRDGAHHVLGRQDGGLLRIAWSPDGRWLTTSTFERNRSRVVVRDVGGDVLFEGRDAFISWSSEGRHMAVVQDTRPLRILDVGSGAWRSFETPGDCWPVLWNPRVPPSESSGAVRDLLPLPDWRLSIQTCDLPHCQP